MSQEKVKAISEWPIPQKVKQVQAFLGFTNFYRQFVKGYVRIAQLLYQLTKKDVLWLWGSKEKAAFENLKESLIKGPMLTIVNPRQPLYIKIDASDYAIGAILSMKSTEDKWVPCAFYSKNLQPAEQNYDVYDKELLAIIRALEVWRHYTEGTKIPLEIWSDHRNLEYFMRLQKLTRRQARWALYLSRFNFQLYYRPRISMTCADILSRLNTADIEINENRTTLIKPEWICHNTISKIVNLEAMEKPLLNDTKKALEEDEQAQKWKNQLKNEELSMLDFEEKDSFIYYDGRLYIPNQIELRRRVVELCHDTLLAGHLGRWKTLELVTCLFWWLGMSSFVAKYVKGCDKCQRVKPRRHLPFGKLQPNELPSSPWQHISADFITGLPNALGYNALLIVCDRFTKQVHIIPTTEETSSKGLARLFRDNIWKLHGLPSTIISDRGPQFASGFMKELNGLLGIKTCLSTAYHPQTDGQTERINQEIENYLRLFVNYHQTDWPEWLAIAEFAYNNRIQSSTHISPFYANYGYHPWMGIEPQWEGKYKDAADFADQMKILWEETNAALAKAQLDMKKFADRYRMEAPSYKIGDQVWLSMQNLTVQCPTKKLSDRYIGSYLIEKVISPLAIKLKLPPSLKIHPVINVSRLQLYQAPFILGQKPTPLLPVIIEGSLEYEVDQILDARKYRNTLQCLVRWKGYSAEHDTWEPAIACVNAKEAIDLFYIANPSKPKPRYMDIKKRTIGNMDI